MINTLGKLFSLRKLQNYKGIIGDNRVMSVGIDPLVAVMNDIKVIDGYHTLYYLHYKYKPEK